MAGPFQVDPEILSVLYGRSYVDNYAGGMLNAMVAYAMQHLHVQGTPQQPGPEEIWQPQAGEFCLEEFILLHDVHLQYLNYKGPIAMLLPEWVRRWARMGVLRRNCASELVLMPPWQDPGSPWFALGVTGSLGTRPHDRVEVLLPDTWRDAVFMWCASPVAAISQRPFMSAPKPVEGAE